MKVALFGKYHEQLHSFHALLIEELEKRGIEIAVFRNFHELMGEIHQLRHKEITLINEDDIRNKGIDFIISVGGDGTFLKAVTLVKDTGVPILGVNAGRLGFLAQVNRDELSEALDCLHAGNFRIEQRALISMHPDENIPWFDFPFALNEVTIQKKDSALITLHIEVDDQYLSSYWADGLIFSTPTGSTAYSLSAGGPILTPDCENIIISPVAPHNLTMRPMVIGKYKTIKIQVESRNGLFITTMDSRNLTIPHNQTFTVQPSPFQVNMIQLPTHNFFNTLRNKLMWGMDKRN